MCLKASANLICKVLYLSPISLATFYSFATELFKGKVSYPNVLIVSILFSYMIVSALVFNALLEKSLAEIVKKGLKAF